MALYRHGLVMTGEHSPAGHVEITYVDELRPIDTLPEDGTVAISGIAKGPLGEAYVELELEFVGHSTVALAECEFDTWTVNSTLVDRDGAGASFQVEYAPELDLVLAAGQIGRRRRGDARLCLSMGRNRRGRGALGGLAWTG